MKSYTLEFSKWLRDRRLRNARQRPVYLFLYGGQRDPQMLAAVMAVPEAPEQHPAHVFGYRPIFTDNGLAPAPASGASRLDGTVVILDSASSLGLIQRNIIYAELRQVDIIRGTAWRLGEPRRVSGFIIAYVGHFAAWDERQQN